MGPGRPMELNGGELFIGGNELSGQQTSNRTEGSGALLAEQLRHLNGIIIWMQKAEGSVTMIQRFNVSACSITVMCIRKMCTDQK